MSVTEFAVHLGVSGRMVAKWEAGGESIRPRPINQAALDTSLAMATEEVKSRFTHILVGARNSTESCLSVSSPNISTLEPV
jgi:hypothetical protein